MEYSPNKLNKSLSENEFKFKKKYGQNFIIDENIIDSIIQKSKIDNETLVIEIGPGAGALTYKLSKHAKNVLCYEIDQTLGSILNSNLKESNNVEILFKDFLLSNPKDDIRKYDYKKLYVIANLPYYITTPILTKLIEDELDVEKIIVMVQKEVGDRFNANPGSKSYNSLTVYLNYYFNISKLINVSRTVFMPVPNVDSVVIQFEKKAKIPLNNKNLFFELVRDSFKQKRKTIKNNLKNYDINKIDKVLEKHNLNLSARAEQISLEVFIDISNNL